MQIRTYTAAERANSFERKKSSEIGALATRGDFITIRGQEAGGEDRRGLTAGGEIRKMATRERGKAGG